VRALDDSAIGDFTRGGQTTLMFFRMIAEVVGKFGRIILVLYSVGTLSLLYVNTTSYERYLGVRYVTSYLASRVLKNGASPTEFQYPDGHQGRTSQQNLFHAQAVQRNARGLVSTWLYCMALSATIAITTLTFVIVAMLRFGRAQRVEGFLRGGQIVDAPKLKASLKASGRAGPIELAGVPLIKNSETSHLLINGSPGCGKTTLLYDLMRQIRARGDRCICYSPSGDFIEWFYRAKTDVILNPFDARSPSWNLWQECEHDYHHDMIAAAIIPTGEKDPFWNSASRILLSAVTQRMAALGDFSMSNLVKYISHCSIDDLAAYLQGTDATALVDPDSEKTALSIRTTAATYARSLRYLTDQASSFRIREWVQSEADKGWVFLNARPDQLESVRPLLSAWLEVFTNSMLSLPPNQQRRIWLICDELPSLNKIPSLTNFLAQSRKYGGCGVITFQLQPQLQAVYGKQEAAAITGLCSSWVSMRQSDPETAKWSAQSLGTAEIWEQQRGLQYGSHEMRDGVSLSQQRRMRELVLPSEISALENFCGFLRMPADVPIGRFAFKRPKIQSLADAYVPAPRAVQAIPDHRAAAVTQNAPGSVPIDDLFFPELSNAGADLPETPAASTDAGADHAIG
jgi:type IV conjugative transfer system coupling protein TraD